MRKNIFAVAGIVLLMRLCCANTEQAIGYDAPLQKQESVSVSKTAVEAEETPFVEETQENNDAENQ